MTAISPIRSRFDFASAMHPTSSLRDPPPNATPPGGSRSPSARSTEDREDGLQRKGKGRERDEYIGTDEEVKPSVRPEKRIKSGRGGRGGGDSPPTLSGSTAIADTYEAVNPTGRASGLAPIKPIGFAASREARREDGADRAIPSPVVMGFDFKSIDEDQLKTVRDTISIKEQQQALIAQRRKEMAASQPTTPRELTFKGWTPKDSERRGGVGARREKTRDKVERMSIVTSTSEKEVVPASKSAPLNQGLSSQQLSPREPPSGSQTAVPQHLLPPLHFNGHAHPSGSLHPMQDPRTAPLSHSRSTRNEDSDFVRQQQPYYTSSIRGGNPGSGGVTSNPGGPRYPSEIASHPPRPPSTADRRNFTVPAMQQPTPQTRYPPSPHPQSQGGNGGHPANGISGPGGNGYSLSPSPPHHRRDQFLAPFSQLYDMLSSVDQLRFTLQDMIHRSEQAYSAQVAATNDFKATAAQAGTLLGNLQQSADSLKEMVRYEVERVSSTDRLEVDELRERVRLLEERISK